MFSLWYGSFLFLAYYRSAFLKVVLWLFISSVPPLFLTFTSSGPYESESFCPFPFTAPFVSFYLISAFFSYPFFLRDFWLLNVLFFSRVPGAASSWRSLHFFSNLLFFFLIGLFLPVFRRRASFPSFDSFSPFSALFFFLFYPFFPLALVVFVPLRDLSSFLIYYVIVTSLR